MGLLLRLLGPVEWDWSKVTITETHSFSWGGRQPQFPDDAFVWEDERGLLRYSIPAWAPLWEEVEV